MQEYADVEYEDPGDASDGPAHFDGEIDPHPHKDSRRPYSYVKHASAGKVRKYAELICDYLKDLPALPTDKSEIAVGSKCLCLEDGKTYILSNHREWALPSDYAPGSGGTSVNDDPVVEAGTNDPLGGLGSR